MQENATTFQAIVCCIKKSKCVNCNLHKQVPHVRKLSLKSSKFILTVSTRVEFILIILSPSLVLKKHLLLRHLWGRCCTCSYYILYTCLVITKVVEDIIINNFPIGVYMEKCFILKPQDLKCIVTMLCLNRKRMTFYCKFEHYIVTTDVICSNENLTRHIHKNFIDLIMVLEEISCVFVSQLLATFLSNYQKPW